MLGCCRAAVRVPFVANIGLRGVPSHSMASMSAPARELARVQCPGQGSFLPRTTVPRPYPPWERLSCSSTSVPLVQSFSSESQPAPAPEDDAPTARQLFLHSVNCAVPMIGFGAVDNLIMIQAGDYIDSTFGVAFGLTTLTAAAFGQIVSDFSGVVFGGTLEAAASRLGLPPSGLTIKQMGQRRTKFIGTGSAAFGVVLGCLLGMTSLLFMDLEKSERLKKQKALNGLFETMMSEPVRVLGVQACALWLVDEDREHLWSKTRKGHKPTDQKLRELFDLYDADGSGDISTRELYAALHELGWNLQLSDVTKLLQNIDHRLTGDLNFREFRSFFHEVLLNDEVRHPLRPGSLKDAVVVSGQPIVLNRDELRTDPRFSSQADKYLGFTTDSILLYPITDADDPNKVIGIIEMLNKVAEETPEEVSGQQPSGATMVHAAEFGANDLKIVAILANHASLFIKSAS